jgi:peptidoglycan/xylan/chitin deacetylase (PgdA/CDA1 family)
MNHGHNLTVFHRLFELAPRLGKVALNAAGRLAGVDSRLTPGLHCVYLHSVPSRLHDGLVRALREIATGAQFVRTRDLPGAVCAGHPVIHLSFDDGVANNYSLGLKLAEAGIPALFFVLPGYVQQPASGRGFYWEGDSEGGLMTWKQIRELSGLGHEIGSHSMSHFRFSDLSNDAAAKELIESKKVIESLLEQEIVSFSFPYGRRTDFRSSQVDEAWRTGYQFVFTTLPEVAVAGPKGWLVGRIGIDYRLSPLALRYVINGLLPKLAIVS